MIVFRFVLAAIVLAAIATQFASGPATPGFDPVNFFSYFTIVSNVFGAGVLLVISVRPITHRLQMVRGAAVTALVVVGIVFSVLLANLDSVLHPWVNIVVHYVMPVAIVADWLIDPPHTIVRPRETIAWLVLPLAYIVYTLIRGARVHWYPYPFLNAETIGYPTVAAYCGAIAAFTILIALALARAGNWRAGTRAT